MTSTTASGISPDETSEGVRWATQVQHDMDALTRTERGVLKLTYFAQLTQVEIALRLELPLATVRTDAASGMRRLGQIIESAPER